MRNGMCSYCSDSFIFIAQAHFWLQHLTGGTGCCFIELLYSELWFWVAGILRAMSTGTFLEAACFAKHLINDMSYKELQLTSSLATA